MLRRKSHAQSPQNSLTSALDLPRKSISLSGQILAKGLLLPLFWICFSLVRTHSETCGFGFGLMPFVLQNLTTGLFVFFLPFAFRFSCPNPSRLTLAVSSPLGARELPSRSEEGRDLYPFDSEFCLLENRCCSGLCFEAFSSGELRSATQHLTDSSRL